MKVLVTSGGTKVPIDGVRDITNMSSGTFGSKIAKEFMVAGHNVHFFHAKESKTPFKFELNFANHTFLEASMIFNAFVNDMSLYYDRYMESTFRNYDDYSDGLFNLLREGDFKIVVLAAAVSDYGVKPIEGKIRSGNDLQIDLTPLPKVISKIKKEFPDICLVGFKLMVGSTYEELKDAILNSIKTNDCDLVVGNDLNQLKSGNHTLYLGSKRKGITQPISGGNLAEIVVSRSIEERISSF